MRQVILCPTLESKVYASTSPLRLRQFDVGGGLALVLGAGSHPGGLLHGRSAEPCRSDAERGAKGNSRARLPNLSGSFHLSFRKAPDLARCVPPVGLAFTSQLVAIVGHEAPRSHANPDATTSRPTNPLHSL